MDPKLEQEDADAFTRIVDELETRYPSYGGWVTCDLDAERIPPELATLDALFAPHERKESVGSKSDLRRQVLLYVRNRLPQIEQGILQVLDLQIRRSGNGQGAHLRFRGRAGDADVELADWGLLNGKDVMIMRKRLGDDPMRLKLDLSRARKNEHYLGGGLHDVKGPSDVEQEGNWKKRPERRASRWITIASHVGPGKTDGRPAPFEV